MSCRHLRFGWIALALALAALIVPVAQAKHGDPAFWTEAARVGTTVPDGFDRTAASVGAAVTLGAAIVLLASIGVGRRYRSIAA